MSILKTLDNVRPPKETAISKACGKVNRHFGQSGYAFRGGGLELYRDKKESRNSPDVMTVCTAVMLYK